MGKTAAQEEATGLDVRLTAAQNDVDTKEAALLVARRVRNRLVFQAVDNDERSQRWVARALGKSRGLVHQILAGGED